MYTSNDLKDLDDLKQVIHKDLRVIVNKGTIAPGDVQPLYHMICMLHKMNEIEQSNEQEPNGYSGKRYVIDTRPDHMYSFAKDNYGDGYSNERYSNERRRSSGSMRMKDSTYYDTNGYSGHSIHDKIINKLESLLPETTKEFERNVINVYVNRAAARD